ncbi:MAG: TetR family transcriptional regulator [Pseudomonadota bacterium]
MAPRKPKPRNDRKSRTRQALLDAALKLVADNHSFGSLSLREVTREVGVVPAAFYRHFRDMEELGLELVEESFRNLRELLRTARAAPFPDERIVRQSVDVFLSAARENRLYFEFVGRERFGGTSLIRSAIQKEIRLIVSELATDLGRFAPPGRWTTEDLQMLAGLMVNAMVAVIEQYLDAGARPSAEAEIRKNAEKQLRLIVLGAMQWKSSGS